MATLLGQVTGAVEACREALGWIERVCADCGFTPDVKQAEEIVARLEQAIEEAEQEEAALGAWCDEQEEKALAIAAYEREALACRGLARVG